MTVTIVVGLFIGEKSWLPAVGHLTDDAFYSFAYCFGTFLPFVMALFMGPPYVSAFYWHSANCRA